MPGAQLPLPLGGKQREIVVDLDLQKLAATLTVEAQLANDNGELFPGAYADVDFPVPLAHGVMSIPVSAVIVDAQGVRVATVDAASKARFVPVQIGSDQGQEVEIVDGLTGDAKVIAAPPGDLVDGMAVVVNPPAVASAAAQ